MGALIRSDWGDWELDSLTRRASAPTLKDLCWKRALVSQMSAEASPCRRTAVPGMCVTVIEVVNRLLHVMSHRIDEALWKYSSF